MQELRSTIMLQVQAVGNVATDYFTVATSIVLVFIGCLSSIISLTVPCLYFVKKQCRQHPTVLIALISLLEAISNYNVILLGISVYRFEGFIKVGQIFHILTFNNPRQLSQTNFCEINFIVYLIIELLSIAYNMCFSVDLLVTLKSPFYSGKKRMKYYYLFSLVFILAAIPPSILETQDICEKEFHIRSIYKIPIAFMVALAVFYVISFLIIGFSFRNIMNPSPTRTRYIRYHRFILVTLVLSWLFPIWTNILILTGDESSIHFQLVNFLSFLSLLMSGGVLNIVRFCADDYLWLQVKKMLMFWRNTQQEQRDNAKKGVGLVADVWNIPLAGAVSQFHSQKIVHNIVQVVLEACLDDSQKEAEIDVEKMETPVLGHRKSSVYRRRSLVIISPQLSKKMFEANLQYASINDLKALAKKTKTLNFQCEDQGNSFGTESLMQKTVFRANNDNSLSHNSLSSQRRATDKTTQKLKEIDEPLLSQQPIDIVTTSYAHPIFSSLRKMDGIGDEEMIESLDVAQNYDNIVKAKESLGASGSFFFFSHDHRFIIKTMGEKEDQVLLNLLPYYYTHVKKYPNSFFARIYGMFSVEIAGISKISFVLMENSFETFEKEKMFYKKYDLKGSTVSREVHDRNAEVFKDINYLNSADCFLMFSKKQRKQFLKQIEADINLLKNHNIMDYSLLVGVAIKKSEHRQQSAKQRFLRLKKFDSSEVQLQSKHNSSEKLIRVSGQSCKKKWLYYTESNSISNRAYSVSLIDYLQEFNFKKYMQLKLKKMFKGGGDISSIDSESYFNRFLNFIKMITVPIQVVSFKTMRKK